MPPAIWPASRQKHIGPAPICGMSHAIAKTSDAPIRPAVSRTGLTPRRPARAPDCQPVSPIMTAPNAPMHQKTAFATRALLRATPTFPFIARWTVRITPRNMVSTYRGPFIAHSLAEEDGRSASVGEIHAFVHLVVVETRWRREEADDLHLLGARIVQHVHDSAWKKHSGPGP